jgi:flavin-binding protein dodecin
MRWTSGGGNPGARRTSIAATRGAQPDAALADVGELADVRGINARVDPSRTTRSRSRHRFGGGQLDPLTSRFVYPAHMAKTDEAGVYRVTEIIGTSTKSWEDAAKNAVETAAKSLRDLRIAEVSKLDMKIEGGKVVAYRARVSLSFKYDG